jgi:hypothetical protein
VGTSAPPAGRAPIGKPKAVPRSHAFQDRRQSSFVIQSDPLIGMISSGFPLKREATNSASPTANRPTASVVTSTPSRSSGIPKVIRDCPVSLSMPTRPSVSPKARLVRPRSGEAPNVADTVTKASTIRAK